MAASPQPRGRRTKPASVLAIFCNPQGTHELRLQNEQRVLQQVLGSQLVVAPAATLDDLRAALLGRRYDVIHFSGHGCVDGPLQSLVRRKMPGGLSPSESSLLLPLPRQHICRRWTRRHLRPTPRGS